MIIDISSAVTFLGCGNCGTCNGYNLDWGYHNVTEDNTDKRMCHRKIAIKEGHMVKKKCRKHNKNAILSLKSFFHYQKERAKNFMREPNYFSFFIEPWKFWSIFLAFWLQTEPYAKTKTIL